MTLNVLAIAALVIGTLVFRDYAASRHIREEWMPRQEERLKRFKPGKERSNPEKVAGERTQRGKDWSESVFFTIYCAAFSFW